MTPITIYHNPACGTSRNTLGLIRNSGVEPAIILYLETPPTRDALKTLISDMGISVRACCAKMSSHIRRSGWTMRRSVMRRCWTRCWRTRF